MTFGTLADFVGLCIIMKLEICYTFQEDKSSPLQISYTYYDVDTDDFKKAVKKATSYFKTFVSESGFTRKAKLKEITHLKNDKTPTPHVVVDPPKPTKRKRTSTSRQKSKK